MSISSTANRVVYTGNGVTTAFSFPYEYFASTDLVVLETVIATGAITTKALTTDYIVSGVADPSGIYPNGGTVTALTPPASTVKWTIYRDPSPTQTTVFVDNASLPAASLNNAYDKLTIICQRLKEIFLRSARLADGDISGASVVLPTPVASQLLGWDSLGTSLISYASSTIASGLTVTTFAASMLASASATTWRSLLGLGGAALLADPIPTTSGGTGTTTFPSLTNTRLAKSALYTVANADKGKTIALGGNAFFALTFGAASGYDANFSVLVTNEDIYTGTGSGRGKTIACNGLSSFVLYPGQSVLVFNQNNVWKLAPQAPPIWIAPAIVTVFVNGTSGNDANDGLATGSGAFATIQAACNFLQFKMNHNGLGQPIVKIDDNSGPAGSNQYHENVVLAGRMIGATAMTIRGNTASPSSCVWASAVAGSPCLFATDWAGVQVSGISFASTGGTGAVLQGDQFSSLDIGVSGDPDGSVVFGSAGGCVLMQASRNGNINMLIGPNFSGNFAVACFAVSGGNFSFPGGRTSTCTLALTFTNFVQVTDASFEGNGSAWLFAGTGAGAGSTGVKYAVALNGTAQFAGSVIPGATVGTTATGGQVSL